MAAAATWPPVRWKRSWREPGRARLTTWRHDVEACRVKITSERATSDPKVFTKIHMHFVVSGKNLTEPAVERAVRLSHEKYCSASAMLGKTAEMTTSFEVRAGRGDQT
jgi:uncharacterized OsmC-like protein